MIKYWADTSAVLHQELTQSHIGISPITLQELEHIKTNERASSEIKFRAREAVKKIIDGNLNCVAVLANNRKVNRLLKKYNFLSDINDHRIICEAESCAIEQKENIVFITCDAAQYTFALQMPHLTAKYITNKKPEENEWCGWAKYYPDDNEMNILYSDPQMNILKCKTNEFAKIYSGTELKDVLFWDGQSYRKLKYKEFTAPTGERISPRNIEQKMYLDLLQNDNIPIKLCLGRFGTGKSMFAETWATHQLQLGKYNKIIFVKNNLEVKGAGRLGILPGDEIDKQYPWLRQIEDHLGPQLFEEYLSDGRIEPAHLSTLRGRDLKNCLILVDEAENLLTTNIQLLLGRVGEGSQIIFCADVKQCDYKDINMSGIPQFIKGLAGNPLFGMVKLMKSERSAVSQCADLLD